MWQIIMWQTNKSQNLLLSQGLDASTSCIIVIAQAAAAAAARNRSLSKPLLSAQAAWQQQHEVVLH
jgi:hypothetical protein